MAENIAGLIPFEFNPRIDHPDINESAKEEQFEDPEVRLKRFLYIGKEYLNYQPGYWFVHNYFVIENVPSIEELAGDPEKELLPMKLIKNAFYSNLVPHPEALIFALAVCCRQNKSQNLRDLACKHIVEICESTQDFILFIKFVSKLYREKGLNYHTQGWSQGIRKAINNWYLSKEPLDLVKCVTKYKSRYGWKHKDILKMAHPAAKKTPSNSKEKELILKYIIHGKAKIKADFEKDEDPCIQEILKYIEDLETFKHCEDDIAAAVLLETYGYSLEHVPGHLLKSKEVWNALISSMDYATLLNNLQRINNLELLLESNDLAVKKVTEQLTNAQLIAQSNIHPASFFITARNYEKSEKPLSYEKRKLLEKRPKQIRPNPNNKVTEALYKAFDLSFKHQKPTNLHYLVTISMNKPMMEECTWHNAHMTGIETGCLIAMMLLRCETNVTVATFSHSGIFTVNIDRTQSFDKILKTLKQIPGIRGGTNPSKPIMWAKKQKKKYDVFINVVDQVFEKHDESQEALISYRDELQHLEAKLITCCVCSPTYRKRIYDKKYLDDQRFRRYRTSCHRGVLPVFVLNMNKH